MTRIQLAVLVSAVIGLAGSALAAGQAMYNWATDPEASDPDYAQSKAICRRLGAPVIPAADRPDAQDAATLKGCNSEALYYGEGVATDFVKARQCAILEDQRGDDDDTFSGKTILLQVYANGQGTARNIPLATAIACSIQAPIGGNNELVLGLQKLAEKPVHFDICDNIMVTYDIGTCVARDSVIAGYARDRKIADVLHRLRPASASLFPDLRTAFNAFAQAHADNEVDMSGTERAYTVIGEHDRERDQFLTDLTRLADGQWLRASHADALAADAALNRSYKKGLDACAVSDNNYSTVTASGVRSTQRTWIVYRDAYVRFAAIAAPNVPQDAILARLTKLRTAELDDLPCG